MGWLEQKGLISDILKVAEVAKNPELRRQILDLKELQLDQQEEIIRLREENQSLKQKLKNSSDLIFKKPFYYKQFEDGNYDGPFCTGCYDDKEKFVRLFQRTESLWICPVCGGKFDSLPITDALKGLFDATARLNGK